MAISNAVLDQHIEPLRITYQNLIVSPTEMEAANQENVWHKFILFGIKGLSKSDVLDHILQVVDTAIFIPVNYKVESCGNKATFLAICLSNTIEMLIRNNLAFFLQCGRTVYMDIILRYMRSDEFQFDPTAVITKAIRVRYNQETQKKCLNLEDFQNDPMLDSVYCPLSIQAVFNGVTQCCKMAIAPNSRDGRIPVREFSLRNNKLKTILFHEKIFNFFLTKVDLRDNEFATLDQIRAIREFKISELWLDGNPLCLNYKSSESYIQAVKLLFPNLQVLDGICISGHNKFPPPYHTHFVGDGSKKQLIKQFVKHYFTLYDQDDRIVLNGLYDTMSFFSTTVGQLSNNAQKHIVKSFTNNRNLLKFVDYSKCHEFLLYGPDKIIAALRRQPKTIHNVKLMNIDLLYSTHNICAVSVQGPFVYRDYPLPPMLFNRTLIITAKEDNEFCIINDQYHLENCLTASTLQFVNSFKEPIPEFVPTRFSHNEKEQLCKLFHEVTTMNDEFVLKYLEESKWDIRHAIRNFTKNYTLNDIPREAFFWRKPSEDIYSENGRIGLLPTEMEIPDPGSDSKYTIEDSLLTSEDSSGSEMSDQPDYTNQVMLPTSRDAEHFKQTLQQKPVETPNPEFLYRSEHLQEASLPIFKTPANSLASHQPNHSNITLQPTYEHMSYSKISHEPERSKQPLLQTPTEAPNSLISYILNCAKEALLPSPMKSVMPLSSHQPKHSTQTLQPTREQTTNSGLSHKPQISKRAFLPTPPSLLDLPYTKGALLPTPREALLPTPNEAPNLLSEPEYTVEPLLPTPSESQNSGLPHQLNHARKVLLPTPRQAQNSLPSQKLVYRKGPLLPTPGEEQNPELPGESEYGTKALLPTPRQAPNSLPSNKFKYRKEPLLPTPIEEQNPELPGESEYGTKALLPTPRQAQNLLPSHKLSYRKEPLLPTPGEEPNSKLSSEPEHATKALLPTPRQAQNSLPSHKLNYRKEPLLPTPGEEQNSKLSSEPEHATKTLLPTPRQAPNSLPPHKFKYRKEPLLPTPREVPNLESPSQSEYAAEVLPRKKTDSILSRHANYIAETLREARAPLLPTPQEMSNLELSHQHTFQKQALLPTPRGPPNSRTLRDSEYSNRTLLPTPEDVHQELLHESEYIAEGPHQPTPRELIRMLRHQPEYVEENEYINDDLPPPREELHPYEHERINDDLPPRREILRRESPYQIEYSAELPTDRIVRKKRVLLRDPEYANEALLPTPMDAPNEEFLCEEDARDAPPIARRNRNPKFGRPGILPTPKIPSLFGKIIKFAPP